MRTFVLGLPENSVKSISYESWQQTKSLFYGLKACDPDGLVIKTRTDKARRVFEFFLPHLASDCLSVRSLGNVPILFSNRVMVDHVRTGTPLHAHDMVVFGRHCDLVQLARFDGRMDAFCYPDSIGPETRWLLYPFYDIPIFHAFFNHVHGFRFANALLQWAQSGRTDGLPTFVLRILAAYYCILYTQFKVARKYPHDDNFAFHDLFTLKSRKTIYPLRSSKGVSALFNSQAVIDRLVTRSWAADDVHGKQFRMVLDEIIETMMDNNIDWLSPADWQALEAFEHRYGSSGRFLRRASVRTNPGRHTLKGVERQELSLDSAIEMLFDYAEVPQEDRSQLRQSIALLIENKHTLASIYQTIADSYLQGKLARVDVERGLWWLKEAAKLRNVDAQLTFAKLVYTDSSLTTRLVEDREVALMWLKDAANRRDDARSFLDGLNLQHM